MGMKPRSPSSDFWKSTEQLAQMREQIPEERRQLSGVRDAIAADKAPAMSEKAKKLWQTVELAAKEVESWPRWKQEGAAIAGVPRESREASPLHCEHANEAPVSCPGPFDCYCKGMTCPPDYR